jgi:hypothetical protein
MALHRTKSGISDLWSVNAVRVIRNTSNNLHTAQVQQGVVRMPSNVKPIFASANGDKLIIK